MTSHQIKKNLTPIFILIIAQLWSQPNTEVYLLNVTTNGEKIIFSNPRNISNNRGYDNQPSFLDDNTILFSSTRAEQTDILQFNIKEGSTSSWVSDTPTGSEYSPLKIPGRDAVSAIRLDIDGLQRLYEYDLKTGKSKELLKDLKVGYHVWYSEDIIVCTILVENRMDLVVADLKENTHYTIQKNVGRSLHKIPNSPADKEGLELVSYISKAHDAWEIKSLHPSTGTIKKITNTYEKAEDVSWLDHKTLLSGVETSILKFDIDTDTEWQNLIDFDANKIGKITRIAMNEKANRLAFVAEIAPSIIVQKQVNTFNKRDLDGFVSCYSPDVLVQRFPNDTMYIGRMKMRDGYERFYKNTENVQVEVVKRITIGNKVIDEEIATVNGRKNHQVALYEVTNGYIASMTFIFPNMEMKDAESVVQNQLNAYNSRDIEAFLNTYTEDVKLYNFPNKLSSEGVEDMRKGFGDFFESTPDLNCEIKKRIVIGNKVIDQEYITANGNTFSAVAIYEVENGKISKVTFVR